ncbi:MAG: hypothetical protein AAFO93_11635 [Pseudomonadota bacterium]
MFHPAQDVREGVMTYQRYDRMTRDAVFGLVGDVMTRATGAEDLKARLRKRGYGLKGTAAGPMLVTLPHGVELGLLPTVLDHHDPA